MTPNSSLLLKLPGRTDIHSARVHGSGELSILLGNGAPLHSAFVTAFLDAVAGRRR